MNDDQLLALVADALADDIPPADAVDAAYAAFGWRTLEADLAHLIEEAEAAGWALEPEVVGFRHQAPASARVVTFQTDHGVIEVSIDHDQLTVTANPAPLQVVLRRPEIGVELTLDDQGGATVAGLTGPVRLELSWPSGRSALTPWFTL